jgi:hypothetical protein
MAQRLVHTGRLCKNGMLVVMHLSLVFDVLPAGSAFSKKPTMCHLLRSHHDW